jgi:hypothetical protein
MVLFHICGRKRDYAFYSTHDDYIKRDFAKYYVKYKLHKNSCIGYYRQTCERILRTLNLQEKVVLIYFFLNFSFTKIITVDFTSRCQCLRHLPRVQYHLVYYNVNCWLLLQHVSARLN